MSEPQFKYPEKWIGAINSLIEHYKIYGQSGMSDCPLCKVALKEEKIMPEQALDNTGFLTGTETCLCPWNYMKKKERGRCFNVGRANSPESNIRRLQGWRKRFKDMLTEGGAA